MGQARQKQRICPAAGHPLTPLECGLRRGSQYACPADCPYNPWAPANYAQAQALDDAIKTKWLAYWKSLSPANLLPTHLVRSPDHLLPFLLRHMFYQCNAAGQSGLEVWHAQGFPGLHNDERFLAEALMRGRIGVLEIQEVCSNDECRMVDLLAPSAPFRIHDIELTRQATRFFSLLAFYYPLPHFHRLFGGISYPVPDVSGYAPDEVVLRLVRHFNGPEAYAELLPWLGLHLDQLVNAFHATNLALREKAFRSAETAYYYRTYELLVPETAFMACVATKPFLTPSAAPPGTPADAGKSWDWLNDSSSTSQDAQGTPTLGVMRLQGGIAILEGVGFSRQQALQAAFEEHFAGMARFVSERVDEVGKQVARKYATPYDRKLVPPVFLRHAPKFVSKVVAVPQEQTKQSPQQVIAQIQEQYLREVLDRPHPELRNQTPRQAAQNPTLRPKLLRLVKVIIREQDIENLETGSQKSKDGLVKELGLHELDFPPPPPRPRVQLRPGATPPHEIDDMLPAEDSAATDLDILADDFFDRAPRLDDLLAETLGEAWDTVAFGMLFLAISNAWSELSPAQEDITPAQELDIIRQYDALCQQMLQHPPQNFIKTIVNGCLKPKVLDAAFFLLMKAYPDLKHSSQEETAEVINGLIFLRAMIDTLARV